MAKEITIKLRHTINDYAIHVFQFKKSIQKLTDANLKTSMTAQLTPFKLGKRLYDEVKQDRAAGAQIALIKSQDQFDEFYNKTDKKIRKIVQGNRIGTDFYKRTKKIIEMQKKLKNLKKNAAKEQKKMDKSKLCEPLKKNKDQTAYKKCKAKYAPKLVNRPYWLYMANNSMPLKVRKEAKIVKKGYKNYKKLKDELDKTVEMAKQQIPPVNLLSIYTDPDLSPKYRNKKLQNAAFGIQFMNLVDKIKTMANKVNYAERAIDRATLQKKNRKMGDMIEMAGLRQALQNPSAFEAVKKYLFTKGERYQEDLKKLKPKLKASSKFLKTKDMTLYKRVIRALERNLRIYARKASKLQFEKNLKKKKKKKSEMDGLMSSIKSYEKAALDAKIEASNEEAVEKKKKQKELELQKKKEIEQQNKNDQKFANNFGGKGGNGQAAESPNKEDNRENSDTSQDQKERTHNIKLTSNHKSKKFLSKHKLENANQEVDKFIESSLIGSMRWVKYSK